MAQAASDSHICHVLKWSHAVLSAASSYKIVGVLPALVKLVASVAQFGIALGVTILLFFNSGAARYVEHSWKEMGHSIYLIINSLRNGPPAWWEPSITGTFKERVITHINLQ